MSPAWTLRVLTEPGVEVVTVAEWEHAEPAQGIKAEAHLLLLDLQGAIGRDLPRGSMVLTGPDGTEEVLGRLE